MKRKLGSTRRLISGVLISTFLSILGTDAYAQSKEAKFEFCNGKPITMVINVINSVSSNTNNSPIFGGLLDKSKTYESRGWRRVRPNSCFTLRSGIDLSVSLSLNYDFGEFLDPITPAGGREVEKPYAVSIHGAEYCVQAYPSQSSLTLKRNTLADFRPRSGGCSNLNLQKWTFSLHIFVPDGGSYVLNFK